MPDGDRDPRSLVIDHVRPSRQEMEAYVAWDTTVRNTSVMRQTLARLCPDVDLTSLVAEARQLAKDVAEGDRGYFQALLCAQSAVLDVEASALSKWADEVRNRDPALALMIYDQATRMRHCQISTVKALGHKHSRPRARRMGA